MANDTIRRIKCLALRNRVGIVAIFIDTGCFEILHGRRFDLSRLELERHRRIVQRALEVRQIARARR